MTIQKYDWVSKDTKLNANGWSDPLKDKQRSCAREESWI